jgi:hypothetical protein
MKSIPPGDRHKVEAMEVRPCASAKAMPLGVVPPAQADSGIVTAARADRGDMVSVYRASGAEWHATAPGPHESQMCRASDRQNLEAGNDFYHSSLRIRSNDACNWSLNSRCSGVMGGCEAANRARSA